MNRHPLLEGLVDYAGLFPPAELPFADAVTEYVTHRGEAESWMLGNFICPAGRLDEFLPYPEAFTERAPLTLSVLPGSGPDLAARVREARVVFDRFEQAFEGHADLRLLEARMPAAVPSPVDLKEGAEAAGEVSLYLEWSPGLPELTDCLRILGEARTAGASNLGAKIRCGGTEAAAFPSIGQVADFILACVAFDVPFKATAGLHHPVRHDRDGFTMHGFLNVFGATVLAQAGKSDPEVCAAVLAERDPDSFDLSDGGFSWRGHKVSADRVRDARSLAHAFGSCSFIEPREDLAAARWFGFAR
ncbi:MAG: hypothetical protein HKN29_04465 [Rhodothermales bacterium]|nr:hypothetical protein [Rhodothermales bacterium]